MAKPRIPLIEMARRVDEHAAAAERLKDFPEAIHKQVKAGGSTGSKLADMVILRSGIYMPETVRAYRHAEDRIAQSVGETALIVVRKSEENWDQAYKRWDLKGSAVQLYMCRIDAEEPVVNSKLGRWSIPSKQYVRYSERNRPRGKENNAEVTKGTMPVDDYLEHPETVGRNSTLGQKLCSQALRYSYGQEHPVMVEYRLWKATSLMIGAEEINAISEPRINEASAILEQRLGPGSS